MSTRQIKKLHTNMNPTITNLIIAGPASKIVAHGVWKALRKDGYHLGASLTHAEARASHTRLSGQVRIQNAETRLWNLFVSPMTVPNEPSNERAWWAWDQSSLFVANHGCSSSIAIIHHHSHLLNHIILQLIRNILSII